ncbi:MAG: ATP-dependent Clp protease adaptor ClpS [Piscirickettsiaceae bacterium]|nr:ATP-dependent Clp protease adaptor ClpS [Piscirickettsiaceae bacterium]
MSKLKLQEPPTSQVLMLNDDCTSDECCDGSIRMIFVMYRGRATQRMLKLHTKGQGLCGIFIFFKCLELI